MKLILILLFSLYSVLSFAQMPPDDQGPSEIMEYTEEDGVTREELIEMVYKQIDTLKTAHDFLYLFPSSLYMQNYHLTAPDFTNMWIKRNYFTILPFKTHWYHTLQNSFPFYNINQRHHTLFLHQPLYDAPVTVSHTDMGLGEWEMNYGLLSLQKGNILGVNKLHARFDYLGQDGFWHIEFEKTRNTHIHLWYDLPEGRTHFYLASLDQQLPGHKLTDGREGAHSERLTDLSLIYEIENFALGSRYEKYHIAGDERVMYQYFSNYKLRSDIHDLGFTFEYFDTDEESKEIFTIASMDHQSRWADLSFTNTSFYRDNEHYQHTSRVDWKLSDLFGIAGEFRTASHMYDASKLGITVASQPLDLEMLAAFYDNEYPGFSLLSSLNIGYKRAALKINNWMEYISSEDELDIFLRGYPEWQWHGNLDLRFDMKHDNAIRIGLRNQFLSEYKDLDSSLTIDFYLAFEITKLFEIKGEAINITNSDNIFSHPLPERYYKASFRWYFIN